jgi:hypothetical protein
MAPETFGRLREEAQGVVERRRADLDRYRADKGPDTVISWEFGGMTYDEFQYFQEWAQQIGESQRTSLPVEKAGVVVRRVDSDLMARKMILGGLVIEEVLAEIPGLGYRAGDVVLCYNRGYDAPWNTEWNWDAMERALHSLTIPRDNRWAPPILRGDRILARETGGGVSGGTE